MNIALTADGTARVLGDGNPMPLLGLGVWQVPNGSKCVNAVAWALELGYRHIDTAQAYGNETSVGEALRQSGLPRDELFVTTKFNPRASDPAAAVPAVHMALGLLDQAGIDGELALREVREGRAPVEPVWGRPQSVRDELREINAQ